MRCLRCERETLAGAKFCSECGAPLTALTRFVSPEVYIPKHLAEKILTSRTALEGERKQVTVLFADMKGSMELLTDRDPEDARKILDPVLERMMDAIHRYEGTVNQVMGDGVMALFGAPVAHEDHAVRACYAALGIQDAVSRYGDQLQRSHGLPVQVRIGLNSGEVVVRSIGSDLRMDYTAVGETTHLASRMEQMAKAGSILVTASTLRMAEGYVAARSLGAVPVRGRTEPVTVYEILGATRVRSRFHATTARGLTRFVGREAEFEQIGRALADAAAGEGRVVALVGDAGVGKSRLVHEFTRSERSEGALVLEGGSVSYGRATPYQPIIDLLKSYFKIPHDAEHRETRENVVARVLGLDRSLEPIITPILALLDLPVDDRHWQALDPPQQRRATLDAIRQLLLRESEVQPVIVVVEDLHTIDAETQAVLDVIVDTLAAARLLLFVNYRAEYRQRWKGKRQFLELHIDRLPRAEAEVLLSELVGNDPALAPLKRLMIDWTDGNPFFLEESVRTLVETRALTPDGRDYRLARQIDAIQMPATVHAVLAARIDRLQAPEKRLLQCASVIGREVPFALLQAIAELPDDDLRRGLAHLQVAEFLYETRLFPDGEYTFKHALTNEVAYGEMLQGRRLALHAAIVDAIEKLYPDRLAEHVERLAHHSVRGERWDKALTYLRQAGGRAVARSAHRQAVAHLTLALSVLERLPQTRETLEQAVDVRIDLRNSLFPLGEHAAIHDHVLEAERIARRLDDPRRLGWVSALMAHYFWRTGEHARSALSGERALALSATTEDLVLQVSAKYYLGLAFLALGQYASAMEVLERNLDVLQGDLLRERFGMTGLPSVFCRTWWAWCAAETGRFETGLARATEGLRIAEAADHPYSLVFGCRGVSHIHMARGDLDTAIVFLERGLTLCRTWGFPTLLAGLAPSLGTAYALSGRVEEGLALLEPAIALATERRLKFSLSLWLAHLGQVYLLAGRDAAAYDAAGRALALARDCRERGHEAWALRALAEIAAAGTATAGDAERLFTEALGIADELGMQPLAARCRVGLGSVLRRRGRDDAAEAELRAARNLFQSLGMSSSLARAERELFDR